MGLRVYICYECGKAFSTAALNEEDQTYCKDCKVSDPVEIVEFKETKEDLSGW